MCAADVAAAAAACVRENKLNRPTERAKQKKTDRRKKKKTQQWHGWKLDFKCFGVTFRCGKKSPTHIGMWSKFRSNVDKSDLFFFLLPHGHKIFDNLLQPSNCDSSVKRSIFTLVCSNVHQHRRRGEKQQQKHNITASSEVNRIENRVVLFAVVGFVFHSFLTQ